MRGSWVLLDKKLPKDCSCEIITHHFRCLLFSCFLVSRLSTLQKVELHIHFAIDYSTIVFKIMKTNIMNLSLVKFRKALLKIHDIYFLHCQIKWQQCIYLMTVTVFIGICDFLSWHINCRWKLIFFESCIQFTLFALRK